MIKFTGFITFLALFCVAQAQLPAGYYAKTQFTTPMANSATFGCAASYTCDPGPIYPLASVVVPPGSYLVTAEIDLQSQAPLSGATCYFEAPGGTIQANYRSFDVSSDWVETKRVDHTSIATITTTAASTTITAFCQRGYGFERGPYYKGAMHAIAVSAINPTV
eukprot:m.57531 g.57531  ORF g.57531 m.57531 type:complete len:164 (+) comp11114_c1_seq2:196-687(+)